MEHIKVAHDLIWAAASESGGSGGKGVRAAARLAGGAFPRRRMTGESVLGLQGSAWAGVWPWRMLVARVVHLGCGLGLGRSGARSSAAMAALDGEASPEQAVR